MKLLFKMQTPNRCVRELNCLTSPRILCVCVWCVWCVWCVCPGDGGGVGCGSGDV